MADPGLALCIWFDGKAEEAARFYCDILPDSQIDSVNRGPLDWPGGKAGDVLTVEFTLRGEKIVALNGGPNAEQTMAMSLQVFTDTQDETDRIWDALLADGGEPMACGWLRDRYGVHWQVVPRILMQGLRHEDDAVQLRVNAAMMLMVKIDHAQIEAAIAG